MIAAAIVCAAAMSQAATVEWGSAIGAPDGDATAGQVAYLVYMGATQGDLATTLQISGTDMTKWTLDNGGQVVAKHVLTEEEVPFEVSAFTDTFDRTDAKGGVNGYYQLILASTDNKTFATVAIEDAVTGIGDSTGAGEAYYNLTWSDPNAFLGSEYTGTISNVPEPTSGLLLLLGVAGLALKRRRA